MELGEWHLFLTHVTSEQTSGKGQLSHAHALRSCFLALQGQLYCAAQEGSGPTLQNSVVSGQGKTSCPRDPPANLYWLQLPHPWHCVGDEWQSQLSHAHTLKGWLTCNAWNKDQLYFAYWAM